MWTPTWNTRTTRNPSNGFTLAELLVVIVVIGILAAIAIPVFLSQADKASDTALKSDLASAAKLLQVAEANGETLPSEITAGQVVDLGTAGTFTSKQTLTVTGSGETLCVEGTSDSGATYSMDLSEGLRNYDCAGNANGIEPLVLTYSDTSFTSGSTTETLPPTISGGDGSPTTYSLSGTLPAGVTFDPATGTFTGPSGAQWETGLAPLRAGGSASSRGYGIVIDVSGDAIITGHIEGSATFGDTTLTSTASTDAFVAKLDSGGTWLWAENVGSTGRGYGLDVTVDNAGNPVIVGHFEGSATFGGTTLTSAGGYDVFAAKLNGTTGAWTWAKRAGGVSNDVALGVSVDDFGNTIATGNYLGTADFGDSTISSTGSNDVWLAKLNPSGAWLWATTAGGTGNDGGEGIAVDDSGNSIVTGYVYSTADFGDSTVTNAGERDIFVAKADPDGNWEWAQSAGDTERDMGLDITVDTSNNAIVTGYFRGSPTFGDTTLTSAGYDEVFVAKLNPSGAWLWAASGGGGVNDQASGITVDDSGDVLLVGTYQQSVTFGDTTLTSAGGYEVFVAKLDSSTGDWVWTNRAGGTSSDWGQAISADEHGNPFITGYFLGTPAFDSTTLTSAGNWDVFVAKLDRAGNWYDGSLTLPGLPTTVDVTATDNSVSTTQSVTLSVG